VIAAGGRAIPSVWSEVGKLAAFLRRDFLLAWSYRLAFLSDMVNLIAQAFIFAFLSRLVDPARMPAFGEERAGYLGFVIVGIAVSALVQLGLGRVVSALRNEQLLGTLEALLVTPTSELTILLGLVMYSLVYLPVQMTAFLAVAVLLFGVEIHLSGVGPAIAALVLFVPFVAGLGAASAAAVLRFRQISGVLSLGGYALAVGSGAYFPVTLFPGWVARLAAVNPVAITLRAVRHALLGGGGWGALLPQLMSLTSVSALSLIAGVLLFRWSLQVERRSGTLGLY
jgi:ABC-2 type transport system permease protein